MKRIISAICLVLFGFATVQAQTISGTCGKDLGWSFDGTTLTIYTKKDNLDGAMENYGIDKNLSPWIKKKRGDEITRVVIGKNVTSIGSCAFARCRNLREVEFEGRKVKTIGWGAFLDCHSLKAIALPDQLREIGEVAFARCSSLNTISIPQKCTVKEQAFASCDGLTSINCPITCELGDLVFAGEKYINGERVHTMYSGAIRSLPQSVTPDNCHKYGLAREAVEPNVDDRAIDWKSPTSRVDSVIPSYSTRRNNTYALIIGNQRYRFWDDVPFALHDAYVFEQYCREALGLKEANIRLLEDATKEMIEEAMDWLGNVQSPEDKKLIVYYAGHGAPETKGMVGTEAEPYLIPTDVKDVKRGIPLNEFYQEITNMNYQQTSIFLDACFSQIEGGRAVTSHKSTSLRKGRTVVFSATGSKEIANSYAKEGHGLFTYYLLRGLQAKTDEVKFGELSDIIGKYVSATSKKEKNTEQNPTTKPSEDIRDEWRDMGF